MRPAYSLLDSLRYFKNFMVYRVSGTIYGTVFFNSFVTVSLLLSSLQERN
jgi:hypothetical protein